MSADDRRSIGGRIDPHKKNDAARARPAEMRDAATAQLGVVVGADVLAEAAALVVGVGRYTEESLGHS